MYLLYTESSEGKNEGKRGCRGLAGSCKLHSRHGALMQALSAVVVHWESGTVGRDAKEKLNKKARGRESGKEKEIRTIMIT